MCFLHLLLKKKKKKKKKDKKKKKKKKKEKKKKKKKKETKRKETEFSCENPGNWHNVNSNFDWKTKSHWPIKILKKKQH
jgi:mannitol-specific phosphotransferase system IIBC component